MRTLPQKEAKAFVAFLLGGMLREMDPGPLMLDFDELSPEDRALFHQEMRKTVETVCWAWNHPDAQQDDRARRIGPIQWPVFTETDLEEIQQAACLRSA